MVSSSVELIQQAHDRHRGFDVVVCVDESRLPRRVSEHQAVLLELVECGVRVVTLQRDPAGLPADRLNLDLTTNLPPTPNTPSRAVGLWTYFNVRDILTNPKYTGHMVWNRRARKTGGNRGNPVSEWIWSPEPVMRCWSTSTASSRLKPSAATASAPAQNLEPTPNTRRSSGLTSSTPTSSATSVDDACVRATRGPCWRGQRPSSAGVP